MTFYKVDGKYYQRYCRQNTLSSIAFNIFCVKRSFCCAFNKWPTHVFKRYDEDTISISIPSGIYCLLLNEKKLSE